MRPLLTSVGSFPPLAANPQEGMLRAVELQRRHGLELLTDGEQRGDMLSMYSTLPGVRVEGGVPRVVGRIHPVDDPSEFVKIRDLEALRRAFPDLRFKVSLTGPMTFAFACASSGAGPSYRGATDPALHDDLTEAIRPLAREVARRGAELQLDEPILSQGMRDYTPALRRIDAIAREVPRERMSLHVCGGLGRGRVLDALFRLENVSTLNLAFAGRAERANVDLVASPSWQDRDMFLGVGCVPVQINTPEELSTPTQVAELLRSVRQLVGSDRIRYVLPDCGLRATPPSLVSPILETMRRGFEDVFRGA